MKYWQNYKRRIKLFLLKGREKEKKEFPCSETENGFGENFDQTIKKNKNKKNFIP